MIKHIFISLLLLLSILSVGVSQTTLNAGEIAIIAMNTDGSDEFSFVLLAPITNGTVINFTENGWLSAGGFRSGEGTVTWTANVALGCGTEVTITSTGTTSSSGTTSVSGSWGLSSSGDQILAYQGTTASPTFIYAVNNEGAGIWQANATSSNTSSIPTGLTNGIDAVALFEQDNQRYDCSTTTSPAAILAAVSNNGNWLSNSSSPYSLPLNCGFTCAACVAVAEPTTSSSSLSFTNTTCNTIDLSWTTGNGANTIVVASTSPITGTPTDQTAYAANPIFGSGSTIAAGEFVIFNGNGTSITVTGLSNSITYYFVIFEYNGTIANCEENYFTTSVLIGNETTNLASEPTIIASTLIFPDTTCHSIDLSWTIGNGVNTIVIASTSPIAGLPTDQTAYTANSVFGSGSTIAAGEFVIYNGSGTSVTATNLSASTTYYFMIIEYNGVTANCEENYLTSNTLIGNFATPICPTSTSPEISGILVNACGGNEGLDEFVTFSTGINSLAIDSITANFPSGGSYCNSGCGTNTWVTNPTYVAQLNTTAACPGLFVEADPIPAGADVFLFTGATPTYNFDFTGLCGTGPYYAIFASNTSTIGRFSNFNNDCAIKTLTIDFGSTSSDTASYSRCLTSNIDGDYVSFDTEGNPTYSNDGCTPTAILPISLLSFIGKAINNNSNELNWITTSEINNDYFTLEKSSDAINFNEIGTVFGAGNSNTPLSYHFIDDAPYNGINYYRLKQTDFDGDYSYSITIALNNEINNANIFISNNNLQINLDTEINNGVIEIYDAVGRIVYSNKITSNKRVNTASFDAGIYIVKITTPTNIIVEKVKF